jgi:hypothetical protein
MNASMGMNEPGLDLHEWETRWAELEEALADDPAGALPEACDEVEELLRVHAGGDGLRLQPELEAAYEAAREVAQRLERGDDVDPGDLGGAVENLRLIRGSLLAAGRDSV